MRHSFFLLPRPNTWNIEKCHCKVHFVASIATCVRKSGSSSAPFTVQTMHANPKLYGNRPPSSRHKSTFVSSFFLQLCELVCFHFFPNSLHFGMVFFRWPSSFVYFFFSLVCAKRRFAIFASSVPYSRFESSGREFFDCSKFKRLVMERMRTHGIVKMESVRWLNGKS